MYDSQSIDFQTAIPFEQLFRHYGEISRYFARTVRCPHTAADLTQETFIRALRYYHAASSPRNLGGWLQTVAFNVVLHYKEKERRARVVFADDIFRDALAGQDNCGAPDTDPFGISPEHLERAMAELSYTERRLLSGFYFEGKDCRELGEELGIRHGYVKVLLFRAREELRSRLERFRQI